MKLTVAPGVFPKQWPVEQPQVKLGFLGRVLGIPLALFNTFGIYLVTVYYFLPFELFLPGNLLVRFILFVAGFILAFYVAILLSEGSKMLVGPLLGHAVGMFQVGPLAVVRTQKGLRVRRVGHQFLLMGGMTNGAPLAGNYLRLRLALFVSSGYVTLLLAFVGLLAISRFIDMPLWGRAIIDLLIMTIAYGLWNQLFQVAPKLLTALIDHPLHRTQLRMLTVSAQAMQGVRSGELDSAALQQIVTEAEGSILESQANLLAYEAAADRGDLVEATTYLNQALHTLHRSPTVATRAFVLMAAAEYEVLYAKDPQCAREWLALCQIDDTSPLAYELYQHYLLVKAAILLAEEQWSEARMVALECQVMLQKSFDLGNLPSMQEKLAIILSETAKKLAIRPKAVSQLATYAKFERPFQPKAKIVGNLYQWASFAFIYFLLASFNLVDATHAAANLYYGNTYTRSGQYEQAITAYTAAYELFPTWGTGLTERGKVYLTEGEYEKAIQDFSQAIDVASFDKIGPYLGRGEAYYKLGALERAEMDFNQAWSLAQQLNKQQQVRAAILKIYNAPSE